MYTVDWSIIQDTSLGTLNSNAAIIPFLFLKGIIGLQWSYTVPAISNAQLIKHAVEICLGGN